MLFHGINASTTVTKEEAGRVKMGEHVRRLLAEMMAREEKCLALSIADLEGVVIEEVYREHSHQEMMVQRVTSGGVVVDQSKRINDEECKSILWYYEEHIILQMVVSPVILTFVLDVDANVGYYLGLDEKIAKLLAPVTSSIKSQSSN